MKKEKQYGAVLSVNVGRDKKSGKIIRFSQAIATTSTSKKIAMKTFKKELERIKKMKGVTKVFGIHPVVVKDKKAFVKHN